MGHNRAKPQWPEGLRRGGHLGTIGLAQYSGANSFRASTLPPRTEVSVVALPLLIYRKGAHVVPLV